MRRSTKYLVWLESTEGQEFRDRQAKRAHERWQDPEESASRKQSMSKGMLKRHANHTEEEKREWAESRKGDKNHKWEAIKVKATLRNGDVQEYVFEGETPYKECVNTIGLHNVIKQLKQGEQHVVKSSHNKQKWPKGTIVTIETINQ